MPQIMAQFSIDASHFGLLAAFYYYGYALMQIPVVVLLDRYSARYIIFTFSSICGIGMALAFVVLLNCSVCHETLLSSLFFSIGVLCCYQVLVFAAGSEIVSSQYMGITIAFLNCINMLGGSFFHTSIGKIMDIFWTGTLDQNGLRRYLLSDYQ